MADTEKDLNIPQEQEPEIQEQQVQEPAAEQENPAENPMEKLEAEKAELNDRLVRMMAEFDNFRKRTQKEKENTFGDAKAMLFTELLESFDNFDRALQAECADEGFKKGVEMIYNSLKTIFEKHGVESFGKQGDAFDPNYHNAVMHIQDDSMEENSIAEVFQKGYKMGDRVLRCAMVKTAN